MVSPIEDQIQKDILLIELKKRLNLIKFLGTLGDSDDTSVSTVDEPNRKGWVRVRLQNDDVPYRLAKSGVQGGYSPYPGSAVVVGYDEKGDLAIEKADHDALVEAGINPLIFNSGDQRIHGFNQTDSLMPLWCGAVSEEIGVASTLIAIEAFRYVDTSNTAQWFKGAQVDLSASIPGANLHRYVALFLKNDGTIQTTTSTPKATITPLDETDKQECLDARDDYTTPIWLWKLANSQASITNADKIEDLRPWLLSPELANPIPLFDAIALNTTPTNVPDAEGIVSWNPDDLTINANTGLGPILQVGQELFTLVYNGTGSQIDNGTVVYPVGAVGGRPSVAEADSDSHVTFAGIVLVTTMDIPHDSVGIVATKLGKVRGVDTSGFGLGDTVWLAPSGTGILNNITNVRPQLPDYQIQIGGIDTVDAVDGVIELAIEGRAIDTTLNYWNGVFREQFDLRVTSNGTIITATITPTNGHPDMTMMFSDGLSVLDTTPGATITLTPGADDETTQANFI
jgi:hypothetical protein